MFIDLDEITEPLNPVIGELVSEVLKLDLEGLSRLGDFITVPGETNESERHDET